MVSLCWWNKMIREFHGSFDITSNLKTGFALLTLRTNLWLSRVVQKLDEDRWIFFLSKNDMK